MRIISITYEPLSYSFLSPPLGISLYFILSIGTTNDSEREFCIYLSSVQA